MQGSLRRADAAASAQRSIQAISDTIPAVTGACNQARAPSRTSHHGDTSLRAPSSRFNSDFAVARYGEAGCAQAANPFGVKPFVTAVPCHIVTRPCRSRGYCWAHPPPSASRRGTTAHPYGRLPCPPLLLDDASPAALKDLGPLSKCGSPLRLHTRALGSRKHG